jgi:hypothetical protein
MEEQKTNAGQGLGITGLILGILAIPLAIIGCTFVLALLLGAAGIVLSAVGLHQANTSNGTRGLPIAGLAVSITGMCIALLWGFFLASTIVEGGKFWTKGGYNIFEQIGKELEEDLEDTFDELEEDFEDVGKDLEETLEELEMDEEYWEEFDWGEEVTDEELDKVLKVYEDLIIDYIDLVEKASEGDISALAEYASVSVKAVALATKLTAIAPKLTEEQKQKFEELQEKYEKALEQASEVE